MAPYNHPIPAEPSPDPIRQPPGVDASRGQEALDQNPRTLLRPRQSQRPTYRPEIATNFKGCQFIAALTTRTSFTKFGDLMLNLQVPFEYRHYADPLLDVFGLPLSIDVELWTPYSETGSDGAGGANGG